MSPCSKATLHEYRSIVFLCQHCHGDLEPTGEEFAGDRVWRCMICAARWIYTLAGWGRISRSDVGVFAPARDVDAEL